MKDREIIGNFVRTAILGAFVALAFVVAYVVFEPSNDPHCTLIDPAEVSAGLDYSNNTWTWQDGTLFGFAPEEDSLITPADCYKE